MALIGDLSRAPVFRLVVEDASLPLIRLGWLVLIEEGRFFYITGLSVAAFEEVVYESRRRLFATPEFRSGELITAFLTYAKLIIC